MTKKTMNKKSSAGLVNCLKNCEIEKTGKVMKMSCLKMQSYSTSKDYLSWSFCCFHLHSLSLKTSFCSVEMRIVSYRRNLPIQFEKNSMSNSYCCLSCWKNRYLKMMKRVPDSTNYCLSSCSTPNESMSWSWMSNRTQCSLRYSC